MAAATPEGLAHQLTEADAAILDEATTPEGLVAAGRLQQVAYRRLGARPDWEEQVVAASPPELAASIRANAAARRDLLSMTKQRKNVLPAWEVTDPAPAEELRSFYERGERTFGVDWEYLAAINFIETGFGRIRGLSSAGARGPMQFIPSTWASYGRGDIDAPRDAIQSAARYLAASGYQEDRSRALYRYNNHNAYVRAITAYAEEIKAQPRRFLGYHQWRVYFLSDQGDVLLPTGYRSEAPVPVAEFLARNPQLNPNLDPG
ncbi:MAG: lytic murein transglycosylase [Acidimicrobiales bacterium]